MSNSGYVNVLSGQGGDSSLDEYSFTLGSTWWRYMKLPDMDQKSFIASPASGNESWGCGRDPSDSPRKSTRPSPWIGRGRIEVDVLSSYLLLVFWFVHLLLEQIKTPSLGNITSFALSLFEWISDASIVSNSSRSAISTSPFQIPPAYRAYPRNNPRKTFFPKLMYSGLIFRSYRVILNQWTNWNNRSFTWLPKTSVIRRLPVGQ